MTITMPNGQVRFTPEEMYENGQWIRQHNRGLWKNPWKPGTMHFIQWRRGWMDEDKRLNALGITLEEESDDATQSENQIVESRGGEIRYPPILRKSSKVKNGRTNTT
jgi:hypothetical protein